MPNIIDDSKGMYKASRFLIPEHPLTEQPDSSSRVLTDAGYLKHRVWCDSRREGRLIEKGGRNVGTKSEEMWRCTCECCQHVSNSMQRQPCLIYTNLYTHTASPSKILSVHICQYSGARLTTHSQILINKRLAFLPLHKPLRSHMQNDTQA